MTYIAFEGPEGSGKSTQASILAKKTGSLLTREPGGTKLGQGLRSLLLGKGDSPISAEAEAFLMAADRAQTSREIIIPALDSGKNVITDRSVYSSLAYQGYGRGLELSYLQELNELALGKIWPDFVVLVDVPVEQSMARLNRELDRFELAGEKFHSKVLAGYRELAADSDNWFVVDGIGTIDEVSMRVWDAVGHLFN